MNDTNYRELYFNLVIAELNHLLKITKLDHEVQTEAAEYIEHREFGLAFESIRHSAIEVSDDAQAQFEILSDFLTP